MAKLHWNPWMGLDEVKSEIGRIISQTAGARPKRASETAFLWTPTADVLETPTALIIRVELAGIKPEDVAVEARGQSLWVYGERRSEKDPKGGVYQALERSHGPFARRFALQPGQYGPEINATFADGLLQIVLSKAPAKPARRRIPVELD